MQNNIELMTQIKEQKLQYIGHVMREDSYATLRLITEGKIQEKKSEEKRQNS